MKKNVVAIIPARGGSSLKNKNILLVNGKPLIQYTIEAAKKAKLVDRIVVSTDSEDIANIAKECGAEVPFIRPKDLGDNYVPIELVFKHAIEWLEGHEYPADIVVFLQPTNIFREDWWIDECVKRLLDDESLDTVFVAYPDKKNYWIKENDRLVRLNKSGFTKEGSYVPRQKRTPIYREDTGLACATRARLLKRGKRIGENVDIIENSDTKSSIDIHDKFDVWLAEKIIKEWDEGDS
jgi:CMP-N-acetylneuraminic acid synthetase